MAFQRISTVILIFVLPVIQLSLPRLPFTYRASILSPSVPTSLALTPKVALHGLCTKGPLQVHLTIPDLWALVRNTTIQIPSKPESLINVRIFSPSPATLVEGPNDASFTYVDPAGAFTLGRACSLSGGLAICSATVSGEVATETETADRFLVQAGTTAAASSAPTGGTLPTTTPGGSAPSNPATTSTKSTAAPGPTTTSGALSVAPFLSGLFFSVATVALYAILI